MLTALDDLPFHQVSAPFEGCATGDHRFFDRYWFVAYDPEGRAQLATGLGVYKNMNVLDGFASAVVGDRQQNVRVSRIWRPDVETIGCGPLRFEIVTGLQSFRLLLQDNPYRVAFELAWDAVAEPFEEPPHRRLIDGWIHEDYRRYYQFGRVNGWLEVGGELFHFKDKFGFRDRSFGVRPSVGGPPPPKPPAARRQGRETTFMTGCGFAVGDRRGVLQVQEDEDGNVVYSTGALVTGLGPDRREEPIVDVRANLRFAKGPANVAGVDFTFTAGGQHFTLEGAPISAPFAYQGFGYSGGYWDERGLGAWRGANVIEGEAYDVSNPEAVVDLGGRRSFPRFMPLEYPLSVKLDGEPGVGDAVVAVMGPHPRYNPKG